MKSNSNDKYVLLRDKLMEFRCLYQQNNTINKKTFWSGSMITSYDNSRAYNEKKGYSTIEGHLSDFNTRVDFASGFSFPEKRYLLGVDGVDHSDASLRFTVYPEKGRIIDYMFRYDEEDNVFYGVWFFISNKLDSSEFGGFARLEVEKYEFSKIGEKIYGYTNPREEKAVEESVYKLDAYYRNFEAITYMVDKRLSTLLSHNEVDDNTYLNAKKYFRSNEKTLKYIFTCEGD